MSDWVLAYDGVDPEREGLREALCTLGNGFMATRGADPESRADGVHYPGTYVAGCWNRLRDYVGGSAVDNESMVNLPNWLPLAIAVGDGAWLDATGSSVVSQRRELDLRRGVLTRRLHLRDDGGRVTHVTQRRFVHMGSPHLAGLETTVTAVNWSGLLRVRSGVDGTVENTGVERYRSLASRHLRPVSQGSLGRDSLLLTVETTQSRSRIAVGVRTRVLRSGREEDVQRQVRNEPGRVEMELSLDVSAGETVTVEKVVCLHTGRDRAVSEPAEAVALELEQAAGFTELLRQHELAWAHLWERFDTTLDGNGVPRLRASLTTRLYLFHLIQTLSVHSAGSDVGVPARGLHGEAYRGHVFWDELFVLPVLTLRAPAVARSLLEYRYRRLPAAREAARACGLVGALYPWQSGSDGREVSQSVHLNPDSGRWLPDVSHLQRHSGLAVAYTVWRYYEATGDLEHLEATGAETLLEIARYWSALATYDTARERFTVTGVMGPDEFHTGYPGAEADGVDNNAYTNVMAVWVLRRALEVLTLLSPRRRAELTQSLGLGPEELRRWRSVTRRMIVPFHDGVISQFEGYGDLEELDWEAYGRRYTSIARLDRVLEAEGRSVNSYQVSKQADVLMLFYLLTTEELRDVLGDLGYALEPETVTRTIDHYLARTSHGSTLSSLVHAWVLARAHRDQAMEHLQLVLESDIADVQAGTTAEGVHLAAMAGSVDLLQRCFTGLETRGGVLRFSPRWPDQLDTLAYRLRYLGHDVAVRVNSSSLQVTVESGPGPGPGPALRVACGDDVRDLGHGDSAEFALDPRDAPRC